MESNWYKTVLEKVPHGEEGQFDLCTLDQTMTLVKLLSEKGYALCITGGSIGDTYHVHWIYAGVDDNLNWADYSQITFTHVDYMSDYAAALNNVLDDE